MNAVQSPERQKSATQPIVYHGEFTTVKRLRRRGWLLMSPGIVWLIFFLALPLFGILTMAFLSRGEYGGIEWHFTFENLFNLFGFGPLGWARDNFVIFTRSIILASVTTLLCLLLALPIAITISRSPRRWRMLLLALVMVPTCVNLVIRTYAWQLVLGNQAPPAWICQQLGLIGPHEALYPGAFAVYVGMVSCMLPFTILPLYSSVERLDWQVVEAVHDLYGGRWHVLRHGILSQIGPGLIAALVLTLVPSLGMFVVSDLLCGAKFNLIGNLIEQQFHSASNWPLGAMMGLTLVCVSLAGLMALFRWGNGLGGGH